MKMMSDDSAFAHFLFCLQGPLELAAFQENPEM